MSYQPLSSRVSGDVHHPQSNHHTQPPESSTERGLEDAVSLTSTTDTSAVLQDDRRPSQRASFDASEEVPSISSFATPSHTPKPSIEYQEDAIAAASFSDKPCTTKASDAGHDIKTLTGWWWWEILATLVGVICMVLLIALLCVIRETPLSRWTWQLEPNSVISILTTASKTALMVPVAACLSQLKWKHVQQPQPLSHMQVFDHASRGPYGSLVMTWKLRFRSPVGWALAFVTILALGIGPSAQNVLWIHNAEVEFTNTSGNVAENRESRSDLFQGLHDVKVFRKNNRTSDIGQLLVLKLKYEDTSRPLKSFGAFVADFHWCLRTFKNTTSANGVLQTEEDKPMLLKREKNIYRNVTYDEDGSARYWDNTTDGWLKTWRSIADIYKTPDNKTRYEVNARWLSVYLRDLLRLDLYQQGSNGSTELRSGPNDKQAYRTSNIFLNMIFHNEDTKTIADRLSMKLTNQMRSKLMGGNANATMMTGKVFKEEPFISVRWLWLLLPLFEAALTAVLLVVSILMTRRDPLLKSSTSALMVYPLEGWGRIETTVSDPQNSEKMAKLADGLRGKVVSEDGVWKFVKS